MSLLKLLLKESPSSAAAIADPKWAKNKRGGYHRLLSLLAVDLAELQGVGGVHAIWHRGIKPAWVYVGSSDDLCNSLQEARDLPEILAFEGRGGLYVSWSPIVPDCRAGVVRFLKQTCSPAITVPLSCDDGDGRRVEAIPVRLPG